MSVALEYAVDAQGCVSTDGTYREITQAQWDRLVSVPKRPYSRYGAALDAVAQGRFIALPAPDAKRAWSVLRGVQFAARRRGQPIETRRVCDPEVKGGQLVLVRAQQP